MEATNTIRVFIVNENTFSNSMYEQYLLDAGYTNITCFTESASCLTALKQGAVADIIFLEFSMQCTDTALVLEKIKQSDPAIYVVLIAEQDEREKAAALLEQGAFDYVIKLAETGYCMCRVIEKINVLKTSLHHRQPAFNKETALFSCR